jgi:hypothetical protein
VRKNAKAPACSSASARARRSATTALRNLTSFTILAGEFIRLAKSASVVVQDRGTDRFVGSVDGGRAMHLARKPIAVSPAQRFTAESLMSAMAPANAVAQSSGFLFRPPGARTVGRIGPGLARDRFGALVVSGQDYTPGSSYHKCGGRQN